jgi:chemotaxis signal transduction protein
MRGPPLAGRSSNVAAHRAPLDWERAKARLAAAEEAVLAIDEPGADALRTVLRARATMLAAPKAPDPPADTADFVVFRLGGRRYAIDAVAALEAIELSEVTALPGVPGFYRGLISHRGIIYPLVDIGPLLAGERSEAAAASAAILFVSDACTVAIGADAIESFVRIDAASIATVSPGGDIEPAAAIRGITANAIVVLDVWVLLADARLVLDDRSFSG